MTGTGPPGRELPSLLPARPPCIQRISWANAIVSLSPSLALSLVTHYLTSRKTTIPDATLFNFKNTIILRSTLDSLHFLRQACRLLSRFPGSSDPHFNSIRQTELKWGSLLEPARRQARETRNATAPPVSSSAHLASRDGEN